MKYDERIIQVNWLLSAAPDQDFRLAELIAAEGRACVIVINKWDAVPGKETNTVAVYEKEARAVHAVHALQLHIGQENSSTFQGKKHQHCHCL